MDMLGPTLVLYLLVGAGVAAAIYLSPSVSSGRRLNVVLAIPFWPLYLPLLLARTSSTGQAIARPASLPPDDMTAAILQVDRELSAVPLNIDGWSAEDQASAREHLTLLRGAWIAQAERIRAMDRLLAMPEYAARAGEPATAQAGEACSEIMDRVRESRLARHENVERLREVRHKTYDDLMAKVAWVRELVSMIHLARFTGEPASRARELFDQISGSGRMAGPGNPPDGESETGIQSRRLA